MEVTGATQTNNVATNTVAREVNDELNRDAFLQLLVLQMQHQDPMDPVENDEMIAQLAQFSSLEQMENMNEEMGFLSGNIDQLNFISSQGVRTSNSSPRCSAIFRYFCDSDFLSRRCRTKAK